MGLKAGVYLSMSMMVLAGASTTLLIKFQDLQCVRNCASQDPSERQHFKQPVWQTDQMFAGEAGCWLVIAFSSIFSRAKSVFVIQIGNARAQGRFLSLVTRRTSSSEHEPFVKNPSESLNPTIDSSPPRTPRSDETAPSPTLYVLALPAICDILSTTLLNVGLLFVVPSVFQMTRGIVVLFSCLFSVWFLKHRVERYRWFALGLVVLGVATVGFAGATTPQGLTQPDLPTPGHGHESQAPNDTATIAIRRTSLGVCIVSAAQVLAAGQFVLEEAIMSRYSIKPLELVGWEGAAGLTVISVCQLIAHVIYGGTAEGRGSLLDMGMGWREIAHHPRVWRAGLLSMVFTGVFNYFALTVTRSVSATSRCTTDTFRTLLIWIVSLGLGWESFKPLQLVGFMSLIYGNLLFNEVARLPHLGGFGLGRKASGLRRESDS